MRDLAAVSCVHEPSDVFRRAFTAFGGFKHLYFLDMLLDLCFPMSTILWHTALQNILFDYPSGLIPPICYISPYMLLLASRVIRGRVDRAAVPRMSASSMQNSCTRYSDFDGDFSKSPRTILLTSEIYLP